MSDLRKKRIRFDEKKDVSQHHNKTDAIELQSKDAEYEQFKEIYMKVQVGNQELEEAQKNSELMHNIEKNVRESSPDLKIVKMGKTDESGSKETCSVSSGKKELSGERKENVLDVNKNWDEKYINLMDSELQRYFKEYSDEVGKYPNWGVYITNGFESFLRNHRNIFNKVKEVLLDKINEVNENKEIEKFIENHIKFSNLSRNEIRGILKEMGIGISNVTIRKVSLEDVYNGDLEKHNERFSINPYEKNTDEKRKSIIEAGTAENHRSLNKLSKEFETTRKSIRKILIKIKGEDWVREEYPAPEKILDKKRRAIIEAGTAENHGSLNSLSEEFETTIDSIRKILVKVKGDAWYKEEYSVIIPDEKRRAIIEAGTADNHSSLNKLSEEFNLAPKTIRRMLVKEKGEDWVREEYTAPKKVSDEKRKAIIEAGTVDNHGSLNSLSKEFNVHQRTAKGILIEERGEAWYKEEYSWLISDEKRRAIIEAGTAENHGSLNSLSEEFNVDQITARGILIEERGEAWYKEEYPTQERIPDEKIKAIIEDGTAKNHGPLNNLAEKHNVSDYSVRKILVEEKGEDWVKEEFPQKIPSEKGILTHNLVKSYLTKVFDERRKQSPEVPKMVSEPIIYSGSSKCADIGFKNIPNYLRKLLSKNNLFQRLNIDPEDIKHIRFVQFDFTNWVSKENIINKAIKYQHYEALIFIVGTSWRYEKLIIEIPNDKAILYPENIKVISYELFADLLDLQGAERDEFMEIIKLNEGNKLEALKKMCDNDNQKLHYTGDDIKGFLEDNTLLDFWMK